MFDFHERRKLRNILYSKPILVILGIVFVLLIYSAWGSYQKEFETREKRDQRAAVLEDLQGRKAALEGELERLNTERGVEAEIRSKFEVAKEGEDVIVIVDAPEEKEESPQTPEKEGFFRRLFGF